MPTFPPLFPLHGRPIYARDASRRGGARRHRRGFALGLAGAGWLLLSASTSQADPTAATAEPASVAVESEDSAAVRALLAEWFAKFDHSIRSLTTATDKAASRALEGGLGALAIGQDRQMSDRAETALADAPDAARRHFELAAVGAPPRDQAETTAARAPEAETDDETPAESTTASPAAPALD